MLVSACQRHNLAVPRAGDKSYVTGSNHGWSRSHWHVYRGAVDSKSASSPLDFQFSMI